MTDLRTIPMNYAQAAMHAPHAAVLPQSPPVKLSARDWLSDAKGQDLY